jgi:hypothetical protein
MDSERRLKERDLDALRTVLNEWDPIGVYLPERPGQGEPRVWAPEDEYDHLRWPLVARLQRGESRSSIADFLRKELRTHYGLASPVTEDVLDGLLAWWRTVR